jgi:exodeoxyribonuclease VII small subunit
MAKEEIKDGLTKIIAGDVGKLTFEQAIKELTAIVGKIEQGEIPLNDSLQQYEKGMTLIKHCRRILQDAEKRIERIAGESAAKEKNQ